MDDKPFQILDIDQSTGDEFSVGGGSHYWILVSDHSGNEWELQCLSPYVGPRGTILENDADSESIYRAKSDATIYTTPTGGAGEDVHIPTDWLSEPPSLTDSLPVVQRSIRSRVWTVVVPENGEVKEYVYRLRNAATIYAAPTGGANTSDFEPTSWTGALPDLTSSMQYMQQSVRTRVWGDVLENSNTVEYVYRARNSATIYTTPTGGAGEDDHVPTDWSATPIAPTSSMRYVQRSIRTRAGDDWVAGDFATPTIWRRSWLSSDFATPTIFRRRWLSSDFATPTIFSQLIETWIGLSVTFSDNGGKTIPYLGRGLTYRINGGTTGARAWLVPAN